MSQKSPLLLHLLSIAILAVFVLWTEIDPASVGLNGIEDGPVENWGAAGFAIAFVGFAIAAWRAPNLRESPAKYARLMTVAWAALMLLFAGEEISWGQRILGIETPEAISAINTQDEINLHNLVGVAEVLGGSYRFHTIFLFLTGLVFPLMALTRPGRNLFARFNFPVLPLCYVVLFVGTYVYGKWYRVWFPPADMVPLAAATEVRELLTAVGMALFGLHAAIRPKDVYPTSAKGS